MLVEIWFSLRLPADLAVLQQRFKIILAWMNRIFNIWSCTKEWIVCKSNRPLGRQKDLLEAAMLHNDFDPVCTFCWRMISPHNSGFLLNDHSKSARFCRWVKRIKKEWNIQEQKLIVIAISRVTITIIIIFLMSSIDNNWKHIVLFPMSSRLKGFNLFKSDFIGVFEIKGPRMTSKRHLQKTEIMSI